MKRLLPVVLAICAAGLVHAESYRIFDIAVKPGFFDGKSNATLWEEIASKDDARFRAAIDGENLIVKHIVLIKLDSNGVGVADQTYSLNYPESYDALGNPKDFTKKKIGVIARLEKKPEGGFHFTFECTELDHWFFYGPEKQFSQAAFASRPDIKMDGATLAVGFSPQVLVYFGAVQPKSTSESASKSSESTSDPFCHLFMIQQIPESAYFPQ